MLDFLKISTRSPKRDVVEIYPKFIVKKSNDLMIRGGDFYAIWNEELGLWSNDEQDALYLIDRKIKKYYEDYISNHEGTIKPLYLWDSDSGMVDKWHKYCQKQMRDSYHNLDESLIFSNVQTKKEDYATKRLTYPLESGDISAYDELMSVLYSEEERHKIEWAIGAIVTGDSKTIQKFMVLYGSAGTGKSTVLNIIQKLFEGYYSVFDAKALGSSNNAFALEAFKSNPLVAIQHDGDLSRIEDNTRLNSLVSHEYMTINEKFKSTYSNQFKCFLIMGTNKPVKITDAKSGLIRRLIDVSPTGDKVSSKDYKRIMNQINFELGPIAWHCKEVYLSNPEYYDDYIPTAMMGASNDFYNFVMDSYLTFKNEDAVTLKSAWEMYKTYCDDAKVAYPYSQRVFKEELKNYFKDYRERMTIDGTRVRNYYTGFKYDKFDNDISQTDKKDEESQDNLIDFKEQESIFDTVCCDCLAQYANNNETPTYKWENVTTKLSDIDTRKLHYVKVPENHIVIDFDIPDEDGNKCFEKNLKEASKWPATYAELSKGGAGIHLHYIYSGDVTKLSRIYDDKIEVKIFTGKSSLRRKLTKCNNLPIASISSGLPLKGEKKMINFEAIRSENRLRALIRRNLMKEIHPATKPSIDFIYKILEDAYTTGLKYDITDMRNTILAFAAGSTHQSDYCIKLVSKMRFKSEDTPDSIDADDKSKIIFYDVEVFPNLFLINWKAEGEDNPVVRMINPNPEQVAELTRFKLVGFNCRRYDNHILYARMMGYTNEQLFNLSQKIVTSKKGDKNNGMFGGAYNISYTDVYDFAAKKQSLKKWEIELGIHHKELGLPWDKPVPEKDWAKVAEYCDNDVIATEAVFNHLKGDFIAREILADLAGGTVNDTTNSLTTKIIFGNEKHPKLVYTDLSETFPGYEFVDNKNIYRGEDMGKGGYIRSFPGIYTDVALLDVTSLHPNSIRAMNCFGKYTKNFTDILDARTAIKHGDLETAKHMMNGKLKPYLEDQNKFKIKDLAQALKIAINSVYGLTAANFDNPFRDIRNKNNIVALRGALFMKTLQDEVESRGFKIVAIKTDSIKIANASREIVEFCMKFAKSYGYSFEHEATYDRICQINDADYIARYKASGWCEQRYGYVPGDNQDHESQWTVTGAQFAVPYVFKKLFSKEEITFDNLCETKSVAKGVLYLDRNERLPDVHIYEDELEKRRKGAKRLNPELENYSDEDLVKVIEDGHNYIFVGKVGRFCPIKPGCDGGILYRESEGKYFAAAGTKGYRWLESEMVREEGLEDNIDISYYENLANDAVDSIAEYGDYEWFVSEPLN